MAILSKLVGTRKNEVLCLCGVISALYIITYGKRRSRKSRCVCFFYTCLINQLNLSVVYS